MVNGYEQIVNSGFLYVNGFPLSVVTGSTLMLGAGQCRDSTNVFDILLTGTSGNGVILDTSLSGVNGIDQGSFHTSNTYYVYVIGDSTNRLPTAGLLSLSLTTPNLPAGYNVFRRVGISVATDGFNLLYQYGNNNDRYYQFDRFREVLSHGHALIPTQVPLGIYVPNIDKILVNIVLEITPLTAGNSLIAYVSGSVSLEPPTVIGQVAGQLNRQQVSINNSLVNGFSTIDYLVTNSSDDANIYVVGFIDSL